MSRGKIQLPSSLADESRADLTPSLLSREMGYKGTEVSKVLSIRGSSVSQCVERGKKILDNRPDLRHTLIN